MKKNDRMIVTIEEVAFPNKGIGHIEGQKVIIKNVLPEQKVAVRIKKKRSSGIEGQLEEVLTPSPLEQKAECPHFSLCGGCTYQNMKIEAEIALKEKQVKSLLEVVTLTDCNIIDKDYLKIIEATLHFFQKREIPFYHKARHDGILRHLVVRKGEATGEFLINLVTTSEINFSLEEYQQELLSLRLEGIICGILHTQNDSFADIVQSDQTTIVYGRDYLLEKLFDLEFKVTAFSFFQTNSKGAEVLYGIVKDFAGEAQNKTVFDFYCGTGTIGQIMAKKAKKVIGIELIEEAVAAANENAQRNGLLNCTFIAGDVLQKVEELQEKPDLIIVDPPRDGIHPKAIDKLIAFDAPEIIYVSCKPTSLARDLQIFQQNGYAIKRVKLVNQFPRTVHVETVVSMKKII